MARHDSNIDPFNAGDPVMPWDDPETLHDDACEYEDGASYDAPEKSDDDYRAPKQSDSRPSSQKSSDGEGEVPGAQRAPSVGTPKRADRFPRKAVVIIVVIILVVFGIPAVLGALYSFVSESILDSAVSDYDYSDYDYDYDYDYEATTDVDEEAGEAQISAMTEEWLDGLADDEHFKELVREGLSEACVDYLGYTSDQLGLDADAYAEWLVSGYSYTITSTYCFDGYDGEEPEGTVYFQSSAYDTWSVYNDFVEEAYPYFLDLGISAYEGSSSLRELSEDEKAQVRGMFEDAMAGAGKEDGYYDSQAFTYADGTWSFDADDQDESIQHIFNL